MSAPVALQPLALPRPAPARVLAVGAWLKNSAALVGPEGAWRSPVHGDLSDPSACAALEASVRALLAQAGGRPDAIAHDLHPDFHSTRVAVALAAELGVPSVGVQHHHAHVGVVQAEQGWPASGRPDDPAVLGLALDGVGLGTDGQAWGGELLRVRGGAFERVAHLAPIALPGGDVAAREPWRLAAAVLHAAGRGDEIASRFGTAVGAARADGVRQMLARGLNCPASTAGGRWFDAAAGVLGLSVRQAEEAEAAIALEGAARRALDRHPAWATAALDTSATLDLQPLVASLFEAADTRDAATLDSAAARFHLHLADALVNAARHAAGGEPADVVLGGGCFFNRILSERVQRGLVAAGLRAWRSALVGCGDAGLALGQAWVAALQCAGAPLEPALSSLET